MFGGFDKGGVYNQLIETPSADKQLKNYRQGYIGRSQQNHALHLPDYQTVKTTIQTHNTIDDSLQRPTEDIGGVYSYQAIEAGTTLQAELRLTENLVNILEQRDRQWWKKLTRTENIGTSKKDDYGLVAITAGEPVKIEPYHTELVDSLVVWLLCDVLIRDRQLRPSIALTDLQQNLERALNRDSSGTAIAISKAPSGHPLAYMRQRRTESWQQS